MVRESRGHLVMALKDDASRRSVLRSLGLLGGGALGLNLATVEASAAAPSSGCPRGNGGSPAADDGNVPRPGPDVLYEPPVSAPQLEAHGRWRADPLLVCGADAHVDGEYVFQSFPYDDNGANTSVTIDPPSPHPDDHTFGPMTGDVVYPSDVETYGHNAADLLEFRAQPTGDGVVYRITLNTMLEPDVAAVAIGIDRDRSGGSGAEWGYGIGDLGDLGLDHVLLTWGPDAELDGNPDGANSWVDVDRNQIYVEADLDPDGETWRHYAVLGLYDEEAHAFKQIEQQPDDERPGGARGQDPPPVFNVGFRFNDQEPLGTPNVKSESAEQEFEDAIEEATGSRAVGYGHWRDHAQAMALADGDISEFFTDIDFDALQRNRTRFRVPRTGFFNRLYASRYDLGEGIDVLETSRDADVLLNNVVPYAMYVPEDYDPSESYPFHVHLHSLTATCNQYASWTPNFLRELGDERGTIIMTPSGRGPVVPYHDQAELDVFEAMADVRARYSVDMDRVTLGGYSNGGIGTHKLSAQFPDLFAHSLPIVGSVGDRTTHDHYYDLEILADNLRTVPLQMWSSVADELAPSPLAMKFERRLRELGWRYKHRIFPEDHLSHGYFDDWDGAIDFLDDVSRETNPQRVRYRAVPEFDNEEMDLVHDGAHWIQKIEVDDETRSGVVDVHSKAFGTRLPLRDEFHRPGTEPRPHLKRGIEWTEDLTNPSPPPENTLEVDLEDATSVTLHVEAAAIDPREPVDLVVESTTSATIELRSSVGDETVDVPPGESRRTVSLRGGR